MPNTRPVNDSVESTRALIENAQRLGLARVFPIAAVSMASEGETLADLAALVAAGAVAFSDDGRPVKTAELMRAALAEAHSLGVPIIDHCETPSLSAGGVMNEGEIAKRLGARGIPNSSEDECVARDLQAAEVTGGHAHIAHLSTAGALEMVRQAKRRGLRVTCEVTPHHFSLTDEAVEKYGTAAKMNPPLRSRDDLAVILGGIADGTVDVLATDHAPHAPELKAKPLVEAPFGIIGFETALALALTQLVHTGRISLAHLVVLMSSNPARIIHQPLGRLQAGGAADITEDVPIADLPTLANNSAVTILKTASYRALYAFFNMEKSPTDNLSFRKALAYSLPYTYVANTVASGLGTQSIGVVPTGMWGHDGSLPHYSFDLTLARQYLAQSPEPTGHVTLTYTYVTGDLYEQKLAEAWATQLATLNITLNIQPMEWANQWALAQKPPAQAQDIFVMYWWPTYVTPYDFLYNLFSYASYQYYNLGYYNNSAFDNTINNAFTEEATNPSTALQDYTAAQLMLYHDLPGLGVVDLKNLYLERSDLKGFTDNPAYPLVVFFYQLSR